MNLDMLYYMKNMPKMQRLKDVDYNVEGMYTSAKQYLFEDEGQDGSFYDPNRELNYIEGVDAKIENFTKEIKQNWGEQESQLRTAVYISFVKETDTHLFRKKIQKRRSTFRKSTNSRYSVNSILTTREKEELLHRIPAWGETQLRESESF